MTSLLEEAVAHVQTLSENEQDRAAEALIAFAADNQSYSFTDEQITGIEAAMQEAESGRFANESRVHAIFGRTP